VKWGEDSGTFSFMQGSPEFLVTPLLMGPVCLLSQGRFEEPVRPSLYAQEHTKNAEDGPEPRSSYTVAF